MPLVGQLVHQRSVTPGPLVLGSAPFKFPRLLQIGVRTVSRRSEPSSRTLLIGEQPNPWDLLQPQDRMSRHRGAKPDRDRKSVVKGKSVSVRVDSGGRGII